MIKSSCIFELKNRVIQPFIKKFRFTADESFCGSLQDFREIKLREKLLLKLLTVHLRGGLKD